MRTLSFIILICAGLFTATAGSHPSDPTPAPPGWARLQITAGPTPEGGYAATVKEFIGPRGQWRLAPGQSVLASSWSKQKLRAGETIFAEVFPNSFGGPPAATDRIDSVNLTDIQRGPGELKAYAAKRKLQSQD